MGGAEASLTGVLRGGGGPRRAHTGGLGRNADCKPSPGPEGVHVPALALGPPASRTAGREVSAVAAPQPPSDIVFGRPAPTNPSCRCERDICVALLSGPPTTPPQRRPEPASSGGAALSCAGQTRPLPWGWGQQGAHLGAVPLTPGTFSAGSFLSPSDGPLGCGNLRSS